MNNLLGVVLCGGESRRMGRDKGLLEKEGMPWAKYVAEKLTPFRLPVVLSVRPGQTPAYQAAFPAGSFEGFGDLSGFVEDKFNLGGPLNGILSVHDQFPEKDILLLACDMLDLDEKTICELIAAYRDGGYEYYVYQQDFFQPFCGIYTGEALTEICGSIRGGPEPDLSLQSLLRKGRTKKLTIGRMAAFANYNSL